MHKGNVYAAGAYLCWGVLPLFWKALTHVPALEILAHRVVWSLGALLLVLAFRRNWRWLPSALSDRRIRLTFVSSATLLSINWFVYIWAVNQGHVIEASLGYFMTPLVSVLLGMGLLGERLRPWQVLALVIAIGGVLVLTWSAGSLPWIGLTLAVSFGGYGLLRKTATLGALEGLTLETLVMFGPALVYVLWQSLHGSGAWGTAGVPTTLLLTVSGVVTAVPLLLFAAGARRIQLVTLGILQYLAPTLQFALGVLVYHEIINQTRMFGFGLIWTALAIYTGESLLRSDVLHAKG